MARFGWIWVCAALSLAGCLSPSRPALKTPFELGRDAAAAGDYDSAIKQFTMAADSAEGFVFVEAHLARGECYQEIAKREPDPGRSREILLQALEDFDLVLREPEAEPREVARARYQRGLVLLAQGEEPEAERSLLAVVSEPPIAEDSPYRLEAYRKLGWLYLERAEASATENPTAAQEVATQERFRVAQEQFSLGLRIDPWDSDLNLGKGMCLHFRGQDREAIEFLRRSTEISERGGRSNARGHYYLARALELQNGLHLAALDHYATAIEQDEKRSFTPVYEDLVRVLPVYLELDDPRFQRFLDHMLAYSGSSRSYWSGVESLADRLVREARGDGSTPARPASAKQAQWELGIFARALARARNGKIKDAVEDALLLSDRADFLQKVSRVFPHDPGLPCYLYGKALTLLGAKEYAELRMFFKENVFARGKPPNDPDHCYDKAVALKGRTILEAWLDERGDTPAPLSTPEAKLDRDRTLGEARDVFQDYLEHDDEDREIRMALGKVQELMEAYAAAFLNYAILAKESSTEPEPFARIVALHAAHLLPQSDMAEAWNVLRSFQGDDPAITQYISETREAILAEARLYCQGCGRKATEADTQCPECGRLLGPLGRQEPQE